MSSIEIIAEIANAHQGSPGQAVELALKAAAAGADAVKFQIYYADEFIVRAHPRYEHFKKQAFSRKDWSRIFNDISELDINIYADIFGLVALETAKANNVDGVKIHSSDLSNTILLKETACLGKRLFLSTGGSTVLEIQYAIDCIKEKSIDPQITLMHGFQAYPTEIKDSNLLRVAKLRELFGEIAKIGYADHIDAENKFATILPLMVSSYGISSVEKHIILDRSAKGVDYYSSFEPAEFSKFVNDIRSAEKAFEMDPLTFSKAEKDYRNTVKKSWVAQRPLKVNNEIKSEDIIMKRTPKFSGTLIGEEIIGKKLINSIEKDEPVTNKDVEHKILAVVVARSASNRLRNKAILEINGKPAITHLFERMKLSLDKGIIDTVAFCTTVESLDDQLIEIVKDYPFKAYRGPVEDVLSRMMLAVNDYNDHDIVLRITGDDLLIDPIYLEKTIKHYLETNSQYTDAKSLPSGTEVEVFDSYILRLIHELSIDSKGTEYLTNYIKNNKDQFSISSLPVKKEHSKDYRLTLDTEKDYMVIKNLLEHMKNIKKEYSYNIDDINKYFNNNPEILELNRTISQKQTPLEVNTDIDWKILTKLPIVTVFITNHNYGRYLKKSIDSVLNQKLKEFELLIIDDGSTDNSKEVIERYRNHSKVKIVYQQN
ncbi:N-acetylneuraminate synthase family protein, partial [Elusimicrobiota bacterium]